MAQVVVVGAGIIGASISKHLADRGAKVTVLEAASAPAQAATGKSWAWLNSNFKKPMHYRDLNLQSMRLWQLQHGDLATFPGSLMLHDERPNPHDAAYPIEDVPAKKLLRLEPALNPDLARSATHARLFPLEGWCDPVEATNMFLSAAQQKGAIIMYESQVESINIQEGKATSVVATSAQQQQQTRQQMQQLTCPADAVVLAAGVGTPALAKQLGFGLPLLHKPAAIVMTNPIQPGLLQHMVITEHVFILQRKDGRVLIGETHPEPSANTDTSSSNAQRILSLAAAVIPALQSSSVEGIYVGYRPYPADGYPVLGWINDSNAYIAVTHSGLTLAPLIGQLVAEEVTARFNGSAVCSTTSELLAPYRPTRNFSSASSQSDSSWTEGMKKMS